jgi:tRNA uridine 5-carboxymethylaminomethyl modification enzyme
VARLLLDGERVAGLETLEGRRFGARAVVLTTGTFGRGKLHIGTSTQIAAAAPAKRPTRIWRTARCGRPHHAALQDGHAAAHRWAQCATSALEQQDSEVEQFDYSWSHFWTTPRGR